MGHTTAYILAHIGIHGAITHGFTTIFMTAGTMVDSTTLGIMADIGAVITETIGAGMTHGTIITITADGIIRHTITQEVLHTSQAALAKYTPTGIMDFARALSLMVPHQNSTTRRASQQAQQIQQDLVQVQAEEA